MAVHCNTGKYVVPIYHTWSPVALLSPLRMLPRGFDGVGLDSSSQHECFTQQQCGFLTQRVTCLARVKTYGRKVDPNICVGTPRPQACSSTVV